MHLRKTFISIFILLSSLVASVTASAQGKAPELQEKDTIQLFRGFSVSYDLAGTVMRLVSDYGQFEGAVHFNLRDRYFPVVEVGLGDAKHETDAVTKIAAKVRAPYARFGCDFNVAKNKHDAYRVLFGARYAFTSFKTEAWGDIPDPYWGEIAPYYVETKKCFFHWAELVFAVDAKLVGPVRLGWSFRYRRKIGSTDIGANNLWYIPGFGKNGNVLNATFNISYEFWRKNKKAKE